MLTLKNTCCHVARRLAELSGNMEKFKAEELSWFLKGVDEHMRLQGYEVRNMQHGEWRFNPAEDRYECDVTGDLMEIA